MIKGSTHARQEEQAQHVQQEQQATGPVLVYLRDAAAGEMDVFAGTQQVSLRNPALARELLHAIN